MQPPARQEIMTEAMAAWLVLEGRELVTELVQSPPATPLAVVERLRRAGLEASQAAAVATAANARARLSAALRDAQWPADIELLLSAAAAEQASDPRVARHRAARFPVGAAVADLGCGAGVDAISLARRGCHVTGFDLDRGRLELAAHNARAAGVSLQLVCADALDSQLGSEVLWHADPGRRVEGRRARTLAQTTPPSGALVSHLRTQPGGALVMGPGVDWADPDLPEAEVEFVQVGAQLTEAVAWIGDLRHPDATATATLLRPDASGGTTTQVARRGPAPQVPIGPLGAWLLDPAPSAARARVHHQLILDLDGHRLSEGRALCTASTNPDSPWWTAWEVEASLPGRPKAVRAWLRTQEALPLSIELHGQGQDVNQWWAALGGVPRGPIGRRLHLVTMPDGVRAIMTRHASLSAPAATG